MEKTRKITVLNISSASSDEQVRQKLARIEASPIDSPAVLNEIRNLVFRIPIPELEQKTRAIADKLLTVAFQLRADGQAANSVEIEHFRLDVLSLLTTLNYCFQTTTPIERIKRFFDLFVSSGSIAEMSEALAVVRQSFESEKGNLQLMSIIAKMSVSVGLTRLNWLIKQYDRIDGSMFFPFLTLFTVMSFCARTFDDLRDHFSPIFQAMEQFLAKEFPSRKYTSLIPRLALKSRMLHSYCLAIDNCVKTSGAAVASTVINTYQKLMQWCPKSFSILYEEIGQSFAYAMEKKEPARQEKLIEHLNFFMSYSIEDMENIAVKLSLIMRMFEAALPKVDWDKILPFVTFAIELLFSEGWAAGTKAVRFRKFCQDLVVKFNTELPNPHFHYQFALLFSVSLFLRHMDATLVKLNKELSDRTASKLDYDQKLVLLVQNQIEALVRILEAVSPLILNTPHWRGRANEKIAVQHKEISSLPFSHLENDFVVDIHVELIVVLIRLRGMPNKFGFLAPTQNINSSVKNNMKMCTVQINFLKSYERISNAVHLSYQQFFRLFQLYNQLFATNIWTRVFERIFQERFSLEIVVSFIKVFFSDLNQFSVIYQALMSFIIAEIEDPKRGSIVFRAASTIFKKVNDAAGGGEVPEMKEKSYKQILYCTQMIFQKLHQYILEIPSVGDVVTLILELCTFHTMVLKQSHIMGQFFPVGFVAKVANAMMDQVSYGKAFVLFVDLLMKIFPSSLESQPVIDCLVSMGKVEPLKVLQLLKRLHAQSKKLMVFKNPERSQKIVYFARRILPKCNEEEKALVLNILRKLNMDEKFVGPDTLLGSLYVFEDNLTVPVEQLIRSAVKSVTENPHSEELWKALRSLIHGLFASDKCGSVQSDVLPAFEVAKSVLDPCQTVHKCLYFLTNLISCGLSQVIDIFKDVACRSYSTPLNLAHVVAAICHSSADLEESHWIDIFQVIKNIEFFREFIANFGYLTTVCIVHPLLARTRAISLILKYVSTTVVDPIELAKLFITSVGGALLPVIVPCCPIQSFTFFEVCSLPEKFWPLLRQIKELVAEYAADERQRLVFLDGILEIDSLWTRYISAEFLSVMNISQQVFADLAERVVSGEYKSTSATCRLLAVIIRLCPSLYKEYEDKINEMIASDITDWVKLNGNQKEALSEMMVAMLTVDPASFSKFEIPISTMLKDCDRNLRFLPPVFKAGYDTCSPTLKQTLQSIIVKRVTTADDIPVLMKWDEMIAAQQQQQPRKSTFGKWPSIRSYWTLLFQMLPDEAVTMNCLQIKDLTRGILETTRNAFLKSFKLIASEITSVDVVPYLIERGIYDQVVHCFLEMYHRYDISLSPEDYDMLVEILTNGKERGIKFAKDCLTQDVKASIIATAMSQASDEFKAMLLTDKTYMEAKLAINGPLTVEQLCLTYIACSYGGLLENEDLMAMVSSVILEALTFRCSTLLFVERFLKFVESKVNELKRDFVISVIKKMLESMSPLLCHMVDPLIQKFVGICSLEDIRDFSFTKRSLVKAYLQRVVVRYLAKHKDQIDEFMKYIEGNLEVTVAATFVFINFLPGFKITSTRAIELFKQSTCDDDAYEVFEIWAKSEDDGGFDEMFQTFLSSITVYMSSHQKSACEHIRIPKNCSLSDVLNALVKTILNFQKFPAIFCSLWAIVVNNLSAIPNPLVTLWPLFIRQVLNIKQVGKKTQMAYVAPTLAHLTELVCSSKPPENKDHYPVIYLSNFVMHSLRTVLEQQTSQSKCIQPITKCTTVLVERFGSQVPIVSVFVKMLCEFLQNHHPTPHPPANPPPSVPQVNPAAVVAASPQQTLAQQVLGRVLIQSQQQKVGASLPHSLAAALQQPLSQALQQQKVVASQAAQNSVAQAAASVVARAPVNRPQQPHPQPHPSADTGDLLIGLAHKILEIGLDNEKISDLEDVVELLHSVVQNPSAQTWSCALLSLHYIASAGLCTEKITGYAKANYSDDIMLRWFPLFWCYEPVSELRMTKYLPFAIRMMSNESADQSTTKFLLVTMLETVLAHPYYNSLDILIKELVSGRQHFRSFFVNHFLSKEQMDKNSIIAIGELLRRCGLTSEKMLHTEIKNPDLRKYIHGLGMKKYNNKLLIFGKNFDADPYAQLTNWQLADGLFECMRTDFQSAVKPFTPAKTYLQHHMLNKALETVTEDVTMADSELISQMNLDHYLIPPDLLANCGDYLPQIRQYLARCISELPGRSYSLFTEGFAKYLMISALTRAVTGEKGSPQIFTKPLPPEFAPQIHVTFRKLRVAAFTCLKSRKEVAVNETPHVLMFRKSVENTFSEPRPPFPSLSEQIEQKDMNASAIGQLLLSLALNVGKDSWHPLVIKMAVDGAKLRPTDKVIMTVLMTMLRRFPEETTSKVLEVQLQELNEFWSYHLYQVIYEQPKAHPLMRYLPVSFYTKTILSLKETVPGDLLDSLHGMDSILKAITSSENTQNMFNGTENYAKHLLMDSVCQCKGGQVPLHTHEKISCVLQSIEHHERQCVSFFVRTLSGRRVRLMILNKPMMSADLNMFSHYINGCFREYSGTKLRGQILSVANSIPLGNGFHLAKGNWIPITSVCERQRPVALSKSSVSWNTLFAERYAAISAVEILLGGAGISEETMFIDHEEIMVSVPDMPKGETILPIGRKMKNYLNQVLVEGPYKHGIVSSFLAFRLFQKEILAYLEIITNEPAQERAGVIRSFSIDDSPLKEVEQRIESLIHHTGPDGIEAPQWY